MLYLHKNRPFHNVHNPALTRHKTVNTMKYLYITIIALCLFGCKSQREKELHDTSELSSLSLKFYDSTKRKVFTVTFNGGKMFVERNIRKVEIKKNMKTNEIISTDTVTLDKKDSINLSEHDKSAILALLKRMAARPQTPKRHGVIDDGFYCDVKYKSGHVTINSNTLTGDTSVASLANLIRRMSPIRIAF